MDDMDRTFVNADRGIKVILVLALVGALSLVGWILMLVARAFVGAFP